MSNAAKTVVYLVIAFAVTWSVVIGSYLAGLHRDPNMAVLTLAVSMAGPAIAALFCAFAFEKGRRAEALGLGGRWTLWWFAAWLAPIAMAAGAVAATVLLSDRNYVDIGATVRETVQAQGQDLSRAPAFAFSTGFIVGMAVTLGAAVNWLILTFTEELGWRGYLHHLWRPAGFWRASLATGLVWGMWHAPAIYLVGLNYPGNRVLGIGLFAIFCMLLSPIMTFIRDRTNSVWSAGLFHGTFNALGGLTIAATSNPVFPWNGIVGIGGFIALGVGAAIVALLQPHRQTSAG